MSTNGSGATGVGAANGARQQMLYDANRKSTGVAYLLWFFLGGFGAHRFYLGQTGTAVAQLILFILGWLTLIVGVGLLLLIAVGIWLFVDLFLIPGIAREQNLRLADRLTG
jgi:TM2 domain-containing membrane protein YozV